MVNFKRGQDREIHRAVELRYYQVRMYEVMIVIFYVGIVLNEDLAPAWEKISRKIGTMFDRLGQLWGTKGTTIGQG